MRNGEVRHIPVLRVPEPTLFPGVQGEVRLPEATVRSRGRALQEHDGLILLLAEQAGDPAVGVVARIGAARRLVQGDAEVSAAGVCRGVVLAFYQEEPYLAARVELREDGAATGEATALATELKTALGEVASHVPWPARQALARLQQIEEPGRLADLVMTWDGWDAAEKQATLDAIDTEARLRRVLALVREKAEAMAVTGGVQQKVEESLRQRQKEQILREQLKAIRDELGEGDGDDLAELKKKVAETAFTPEARKVAERELRRLEGMGAQSPEAQVARNYLEWLTSVPWTAAAGEVPDLDTSAQVLADAHYGLDKVKERILEYIAVRQLLATQPRDEAAPRARTPILCLYGPPGVGKTSLGQAVAKALNRPFVRISLGGVSDEAEVRGHRRTYIGALPGRIIQGMRRAGATNPVFLLDEVDKVGMSWRGDVSSALLEVLDPEQNHTFQDHYLEVPYDLSQVFFIATANVIESLPGPLRDRLEVIEVPGYTEDEKLGIAREHLIAKQMVAHGLPADAMHLPDETLLALIRGYTAESGVRQLERQIGNLCRKRARRYAAGETGPLTLEAEALAEFIGPAKVRPPKVRSEDEVGVVNGVAYTGRGGDTLTIEVALMPGKGELVLTGQLGDVMQESAQAAYSVVKSRAAHWGIDPEVFSKTQVHLHVPAGAVPKDGPSAGVTMATALLSAFTGRKVAHDVAMTGEITLRGKVLPIGGLKEKSLAALRHGCTTFILPQDNAVDLAEITPAARAGLTFITATDVSEVWAAALVSGGTDLQPGTGLGPLPLDAPAPAPPALPALA